MKVHELFAYLIVNDAAGAIEFYKEAFGATEKFRLVEQSGRIGHVELDFGGTILMLADEFPEYDVHSPVKFGGTPVTIHLHVDDADDVIQRAVRAGAQILIEPKDNFYGERSGTVRDPFGHRWKTCQLKRCSGDIPRSRRRGTDRTFG
jgi:uncharacterized glyoxalase superfamily protein PhnB